MADTDHQTETIASYSKLKILPLLFIMLLLGGIAVWSWFTLLSKPPGSIDYGILPDYILYVWSALYLIVLPIALEIVRQVLFNQSRAVWIEKGLLIFLNRHFFSVRCADITGISLERYGPYNQQGIGLLTKSGQKKILGVGMLSDSPNIISDRLRKICLS